MGNACGKARPKYIQHVRALYPRRGQPADQAQNISNFVHYAASNPRHLRAMAEYLLRRLNKHLRRGEKAKFKVILTGVNNLIDLDTERLGLLEDILRSVISLLFAQVDVDFRIWGTDTLSRYAKQQNVDDADSGKLDPFFKPLNELCVFKSDDSTLKVKVRVSALSALEEVLIHSDKSHSKEYFDSLIPAILENAPEDFAFEEKSDDAPDSSKLKSLSVSCFKIIAELMDISTAGHVVKPVVKFFDDSKASELFLSKCLCFLADSSRELPSSYPITYELLRHANMLRMKTNWTPADCQSLIKILGSLEYLVRNMSLPVGSWQGLLSLLLQMFHSTSDDDRQNSPELAESFLKVLDAYCCRLPDAYDHVQLVDSILEQLTTGEAKYETKLRFLQAALLVSHYRKSLPVRTFIPSHMFRSLFFLLEKQSVKSDKFSDLSMQILSNLLIPIDALGIVESRFKYAGLESKSLKWKIFLSRIASGDRTLKVDDCLDTVIAKAVRVYMYQEIFVRRISPTQYHFAVLVALLKSNISREYVTAPLVAFYFGNLREAFSLPLYTFCLAYIYFVVHVCSSLEGHSKEVEITRACAQLEDYVKSYVTGLPDTKVAGIEFSAESGYSSFKTDSKVDVPPPEKFVDSKELLGLIDQFPFESPKPETFKELLESESSWFATFLTKSVELVEEDKSEKEFSQREYSASNIHKAISSSPQSMEDKTAGDDDGLRKTASFDFTDAIMGSDFKNIAEGVSRKQQKTEKVLASVISSSFGVMIDEENDQYNGAVLGGFPKAREISEDIHSEDQVTQENFDEDPVLEAKDTFSETIPKEDPSKKAPDFLSVDGSGLEEVEVSVSAGGGKSTLRRKFPKLVGESNGLDSVFSTA